MASIFFCNWIQSAFQIYKYASIIFLRYALNCKRDSFKLLQITCESLKDLTLHIFPHEKIRRHKIRWSKRLCKIASNRGVTQLRGCPKVLETAVQDVFLDLIDLIQFWAQSRCVCSSGLRILPRDSVLNSAVVARSELPVQRQISGKKCLVEYASGSMRCGSWNLRCAYRKTGLAVGAEGLAWFIVRRRSNICKRFEYANLQLRVHQMAEKSHASEMLQCKQDLRIQ